MVMAERPRQRPVQTRRQGRLHLHQGILQSTVALYPQGRSESGDRDQLPHEAVDPVHRTNLPLHIDSSGEPEASIPAWSSRSAPLNCRAAGERQ